MTEKPITRPIFGAAFWLLSGVGSQLRWSAGIIAATLILTLGFFVWGSAAYASEVLADRKGTKRAKLMIMILTIAGGCAFALAALLYLTQTLPKPMEQSASSTGKPSKVTSLPAVPSLLSLFMNDFREKGSGGGVAIQYNAFADLTFSDNTKLRVFYTVIEDHGSRSKFMTVYVPRSKHTYEICEFLAAGYKEYLNPRLQAETGTAHSPQATRSSELVFTGRIFIYHEDALTISQLGKLSELYEQQGASPEFRGNSYALDVWNSIRAGDIKPPPGYEIHDNLPRMIPAQVDGGPKE